MAFVEPITIKEAIDNVYKINYILPAIQREFVWSPDQIVRLFDSLMRDYPINSFLFWEIEKRNINNYQFYEFVRDYHERDNTHNPKANLKGEKSITAILDGQQRLTALYIGLKGSYASKLPRMRWDNDLAFPKRKLCLNLISAPINGDMLYNFQFLTKKEYKENDDSSYWFIVGDILNLEKSVDINKYLIRNGLLKLPERKAEYANETLFKFWEIIYKNRSINFFLEKGESLDKVLNIFIRVNSGGTQLSYSDLLLSIATAQWKKKDAREEITTFVDEINHIGDKFNFNKDFVLKCCLVLSDFPDIAFKVDNFNQKNMLFIENAWEKISESIRSAVYLLSNYGYHRDTLTSNNAVIPIAYYLKKIGNPSNYIQSAKYEKERKKIFKWLVIALLKRTFGGQPDSVLRPIREVIKKSQNSFPYNEIINRLKRTTKAMSFDEEEFENILFYKYGQAYTYSVLAFLYPTFDFRNKFHQDHIFPKKYFTKKRLSKAGIESEKQDFFLDNYNYLANLQLLEGTPNREKSAKHFNKWIIEQYPNKKDRQAYMERHYIPDIDLSINNFDQFINEREKMIINAFKKLI